MIDGVRGLHTAFSELGKITDGVDFKSPFATLQLAKNAIHRHTGGLEIGHSSILNTALIHRHTGGLER